QLHPLMPSKKRKRKQRQRRSSPGPDAAIPAPTRASRWLWAVGAMVLFGLALLTIRTQMSNRSRDSSAPSPTAGRAVREEATAAETDPVTEQGLVTVTTPATTAEVEADQRRLDPTQDGWLSEAVAEDAKQALLVVLRAINDRPATAIETLTDLASDRFQAGTLRPAGRESYRDETLTINESVRADDALQPTDLPSAVAPLGELMAPAHTVDPHVKVIRVEMREGTVDTSAIIELDGALPDGGLSVRALWDCRWQRDATGRLRLQSIAVRAHTEVHSTGPNWLTDVTPVVAAGLPAFSAQLAHGLNHWLPRLERVHGLHAFARWGIAVGDVNGDQLDDVYVCQPGGLPNRLLIRQPDGTVADRSRASQTDYLDHTSSALLVDLDNDGDQDLVLATASGLLLMANAGQGQFDDPMTLTTDSTDFMSLSAVDYDNDGDLDLYACLEFPQQGTDGSRPAFVYHDANDGAANALFRNDSQGDLWSFVDITAEVGLNTNNARHSLAAAWEDFDNDGDQDLYVANDYGQNCLYRNDDGQFFEIAPETGVVDSASGMSVSWGDFNRDGWMDLYVANMFSSAGNRITRQQAFKPEENADTLATYQRFAKGNSLFANIAGQFEEVSADAHVEMGRWAWSSLFADLNNDGWEDLLVANGYITTEDTGDL
ncbi:MAG: VCBS repeat-containing protein, partial [Planctomycetota bacterium]